MRFGYREDEASVRGPYVPLARVLPVTTAAFSAPLACKLCAEIPPVDYRQAATTAGSAAGSVGAKPEGSLLGGM